MGMVLTTTRDKTVSCGHKSGRKVETRALESSPSVRRCLVTGDLKPKEELVRFVLDPQGRVVPDLAERLPGHGLWVSASQEALQTAVKKNLFARAAKAVAKTDPGLFEQVHKLFERRCLDWLGLARGAGLAATGFPQLEEMLKTGKLAFILTACDAGQDMLKKLSRAPTVRSFLTRDLLGEALGREQAVAVGLKPHALTAKLRVDLMRWQGVKGEAQPIIDKTMDSETT